MKTEKIILASASPRRRELLHQIGLETEVLPSRIEEKPTATQPEEVVEELSRQKCLDVAGKVQENGDGTEYAIYDRENEIEQGR